MILEDLVGKHVLSGIEEGMLTNPYDGDCAYIKFTLDGITYKAIENPDDGYRSFLNELEIVDEKCKIRVPDIEVVCHMREYDKPWENDVLCFVDAANGEIFLSIGTENTNNYYPYCVMEYFPERLHCNQKEKREGS